MINFLIQAEQNEEDTLNHIPVHDFSFALIEAINYSNWYYKDKKFEYELKESNTFSEYEISHYIPIGSVEFVQNFIKTANPRSIIKPINIPKQLMDHKYLGRIVCKNDLFAINSKTVFIKDDSQIKGVSEFVDKNSASEFIKNKNLVDYIASETIDIESEWRGFVYNKELVDIKNYSGAFDIFPDIKSVREMVSIYTNCPPAYTIDVAVTNYGTFLIECHNFFSCGLYGFSDYTILPNMLIKAFKWQLENIE